MSLLGTLEKVSKAGVMLAPTIRGLTGYGNDKLGGVVLRNTGYNIRTGEWRWDEVVNSATPILAIFLGWKAFHKINGIIRAI